ncbi:MAG: hypothetical protein NZM27_13685 [Acetobacteraceae bacterium]|nr:hypothetical protein [Acetobacteraceae bacterium]MCX7685459.1 hypothetical protein [Acetobacteraceae bacterium]MDW8399034.1 hypothetical protein [Acetobacteraceae bacterium]
MIKASLVIVTVLTVIFAMLLRWREERLDRVAAAAGAPRRQGWLALGRRRLNRWITAAALAALVTMAGLGGVQWMRVWISG